MKSHPVIIAHCSITRSVKSMDIKKSIRIVVNLLIAVGLMTVGTIFVVWPVQYLGDGIEMSSWEEKQCVIDSFWFEQTKTSTYWNLHVRFYYTHKDKRYTSENLSLDAVDFIDIGDAGPLVSAMTPGTEHTCYINTGNPPEAILIRPMKLEMFIWAVGLFFGVSFFILGAIASKNIIFRGDW